MAYIDLGKYSFTTGQDYTGLNTGNLTSILDLSQVNIPYFEMYRLVIDTSSLSTVTPIPTVVQDSGFVSGTSLTTLNVTMPKATTVGNTLIAGFGSFGAALNPTVTGITIGAQADHWGIIGSAAGGTGTDAYAVLWADPSCQQASTAVVITSANGSGATVTAARVIEVANLLATSSAAASWDVGATGATTGGAVTSFPLNPGVTKAANDLAVAIGYFSSSASSLTSIVPAPWNTVYGTSTVSAQHVAAAASYGYAGPAGSSFPWSATTSNPAGGAAVQAAFLASATPVAAPAFPFSVFVDQAQFDIQTTATGTGYTYTLGQSPLYLRTGQHLQVLWTSLPFATYATYAPYLKCTAYFRYDPAAQQSGSVTGHA